MFKKFLLSFTAFIIIAFGSNPLKAIAINEGDLPVLSNLKVQPQEGLVETNYTVTLNISDQQGPNDIINILYQIREETEVMKVPINDQGIEGDLTKGDGIYTGRSFVPKTASEGTHIFKAFVFDKDGHKSNVLEYSFTVLEET